MINQCSRNGHTLPLPAGKLIRLVMHAIRQFYHRERHLCALGAFFGADTAVNQRQLNVVQGSSARQQVEGLEDKSNFFIPDTSQLVVIHFADELAVQPIPALGRCIQAADQIHQC